MATPAGQSFLGRRTCLYVSTTVRDSAWIRAPQSAVINLWIIYNMVCSEGSCGNITDSYRYRDPKRSVYLHARTLGGGDGNGTLKSHEGGPSRCPANLPMDPETPRLSPNGADPVKPRPTCQEIQPPHTLGQLLVSLSAVRKRANPFMERGGDHVLSGT